MENLLENHAREKVGMPQDWQVWSYEVLDHESDDSTMKITGAIAPIVTRGKRKGLKNWRKKDKATIRNAYIRESEHDEWLSVWESKTGNCHKCQGTGEMWAGWSAKDGTRYRTCTRCSGSGSAPNKYVPRQKPGLLKRIFNGSIPSANVSGVSPLSDRGKPR